MMEAAPLASTPNPENHNTVAYHIPVPVLAAEAVLPAAAVP